MGCLKLERKYFLTYNSIIDFRGREGWIDESCIIHKYQGVTTNINPPPPRNFLCVAPETRSRFCSSSSKVFSISWLNKKITFKKHKKNIWKFITFRTAILAFFKILIGPSPAARQARWPRVSGFMWAFRNLWFSRWPSVAARQARWPRRVAGDLWVFRNLCCARWRSDLAQPKFLVKI